MRYLDSFVKEPAHVRYKKPASGPLQSIVAVASW
jgi:hypothetical protein